jgi:peptidoglycan/xylan/chitin deacetylase (PgdA/CDA1 family)
MFSRKAWELSDARSASLVFKLTSLGLLFLAFLPKSQSQTVAMTVDDLPYVPGLRPLNPNDRRSAILTNERILHAFTRHHIPAIGFVNEKHGEQLGAPTNRKILEQWIRSGFDLGNHFYAHADVDSITVEQAEQEILRGETTIRPLLESASREPRYMRFPYNHTGDTKEKHDAIAAFLAAHGYRMAPCTIDNSDYEFNQTYALALARHDMRSAAKVRADYIAYTASEIDWYTKLDRQVFGRDLTHIMLLHDSLLNADTIEAVITLFAERGYRFVTLTEALQDPAYATPETYITKFGPMWGYRWARELNVNVNGRDEPDPPAWINQYVKEAPASAN